MALTILGWFLFAVGIFGFFKTIPLLLTFLFSKGKGSNNGLLLIHVFWVAVFVGVGLWLAL